MRNVKRRRRPSFSSRLSSRPLAFVFVASVLIYVNDVDDSMNPGQIHSLMHIESKSLTRRNI